MQLRYYILRRLLFFVPVLFGLSLITFTVSHLVPGDPVGLAAGPGATPQEIEQLKLEFGTDKPLPEQYLTYMSRLLHGDLGRSMTSHHKVMRFLERNQTALRSHPKSEHMREIMYTMVDLLSGPDDPLPVRLKCSVALFALHAVWFVDREADHTDDDRTEAALAVALELVDPHAVIR